jgi:hypothetical protein
MAIVLSTSGGTPTAPSRFRKWLQSIYGLTPVTGASVSDASPLVVTKTAHGFANGDIVVGTGAVNNPNANGPLQVLYVNANQFKLVPMLDALTAGNGVNGGGSSADSSVTFQRLYIDMKPHDILNWLNTLSRVSYVRDSDAQDPTYPDEYLIAFIFGITTY